MISNVINPTISLVKLAHQLIQDQVKSGDVVLDATVGNGHDTRFLLDLVKPDGKVFGFEIQQAAINSARQNLHAHPAINCLTLIQASHATMLEHIPGNCRNLITAVMFNLGYLPGGDKSIITRSRTTLVALTHASAYLSTNGIITILAYPGHVGGDVETEHVKKWCSALDASYFQVNSYENQPDNQSAPKLFVVHKIG